MTPAAEAAFYERRFADVGDRADRYAQLYAAAAELVPVGSTLVELGCGAGGFYPFALARHAQYAGVDFAPALITAARARWGVVAGVFDVADLRTDPIPFADCYVALEVLEHLDDDLALLGRLPAGARVILSVPSFASASHVRTFEPAGSARARYGGLVAVDVERRIELGAGTYFHLLAGAIV